MDSGSDSCGRGNSSEYFMKRISCGENGDFPDPLPQDKDVDLKDRKDGSFSGVSPRDTRYE